MPVVCGQHGQVQDVHHAVAVKVAVGPTEDALPIIRRQYLQILCVHRAVLVDVARQDVDAELEVAIQPVARHVDHGIGRAAIQVHQQLIPGQVPADRPRGPMGEGVITKRTEPVARHIDARQYQVAFRNIHVLAEFNDDLVQIAARQGAQLVGAVRDRVAHPTQRVQEVAAPGARCDQNARHRRWDSVGRRGDGIGDSGGGLNIACVISRHTVKGVAVARLTDIIGFRERGVGEPCGVGAPVVRYINGVIEQTRAIGIIAAGPPYRESGIRGRCRQRGDGAGGAILSIFTVRSWTASEFPARSWAEYQMLLSPSPARTTGAVNVCQWSPPSREYRIESTPDPP